MGVFRLLLAFSVIASHTSAILGTTMYPGGMAVQMFFMISGFYMALVLDGRYAPNPTGLRLFYSNRALRLYPAFLTITVGIWVQFLITWIILGHTPGNNWVDVYRMLPRLTKLAVIAMNWLMVGTDTISNMYFSHERGVVFMFPREATAQEIDGMVFMHNLRTIAPAWSIGTEIWFYLLVPFLVRWRWSLLAVLFIGSFACRLWIVEVLGRYPFYFFPAQLIFFIGGIWAYKCYRRWGAALHESQWTHFVAPLNWVAVLVYPFCFSQLPSWPLYILVGISIPCMFNTSKQLHWDRLVGDLSYPVYLVHLWVGSIASRWAIANGTFVAAVSVLAALAIFFAIERPVERFRRRRVEADGYPATSA